MSGNSGGHGVSIPITASLKQGDIQAELAKLATLINGVGTKIASANRVKFTPIDKAPIEDAKRLEQQYERLLKVSGEIRRRVKETGQSGKSFLNLDWAQLHPDAGARNRQSRKAFWGSGCRGSAGWIGQRPLRDRRHVPLDRSDRTDDGGAGPHQEGCRDAAAVGGAAFAPRRHCVADRPP